MKITRTQLKQLIAEELNVGVPTASMEESTYLSGVDPSDINVAEPNNVGHTEGFVNSLQVAMEQGLNLRLPEVGVMRTTDAAAVANIFIEMTPAQTQRLRVEMDRLLNSEMRLRLREIVNDILAG